MTRQIFKIMGKHNGTIEELDTTVGDSNAKTTVKDFKANLGNEWEVWAEDNTPKPDCSVIPV